MFGFLKKKTTVDDLLAAESVPDSGYLLVSYFDPGTLYDGTLGYEVPASADYYGDDYDGGLGTGPALKVTITDGPLDEPFTEYFDSVSDFTQAVNSFHHLYGYDGPVTLVIEAV
jgi:hypothetical protein